MMVANDITVRKCVVEGKLEDSLNMSVIQKINSKYNFKVLRRYFKNE